MHHTAATLFPHQGWCRRACTIPTLIYRRQDNLAPVLQVLQCVRSA